MTSDIDAMQELISQGLVLFVQNIFLFVGAVIVILVLSWQLALGMLVIVPPVFFASRWFRRVSNKALPRRFATASRPTSRTLQEGLEGVRVVQAFGRERAVHRPSSRRTNEDQYEANMVHGRRSRRSTSRSSSTPGSFGHGGDHRLRRLARDARRRHGRNRRRVRAVPQQRVRADQPAQPALQHRAVGGRGAATRSSACSTPRRRPCENGRVPSTSPADRRDRRRCTSRSRTATTSRCCTTCPDDRRSGRAARARRPDRRRQVDARQARSPASTTRPKGAVRVGGVDLRDATFKSLRERIVVVPQEGFLFAGTLPRQRSQSAGPEATDAEVDDALASSGSTNGSPRFPTASTPRCASAVPGCRRGSASSSHWRAPRSPIRRCSILDEATSNLDPGTEHAVERALESLMRRPHGGRGRAPLVDGRARRPHRSGLRRPPRRARQRTPSSSPTSGHYAALYRAWATHQDEEHQPDVA